MNKPVNSFYFGSMLIKKKEAHQNINLCCIPSKVLLLEALVGLYLEEFRGL